MRSLSRVIKSSWLVLTPPRVITCPDGSTADQAPEPLEPQKVVTAGVDLGELEQQRAAAAASARQLVEDARREAAALIQEARTQAKKILEDGRKELDRIREEAREAGYREGYQAGEQALAAKWEELKQEAAAQRAGLVEARKKLIREMEPQLLQLALQLARRVLHTELKLNPGQIGGVVKATLGRALETGEVVLRVPSSEYEVVMELLAETGCEGMVKVEVDDSVTAGCLAETGYGVLDARVDSQLKELGREMFEVLAG